MCVRSRPAPCPTTERIAQSPHDRLQDIRRALRAADGALARQDAKTADAMVESARSQLGLIYERYPGEGLERSRAELKAADLSLASLRGEIDRGGKQTRVHIAEWIASSSGLEKTLVRDQPRSLFNPQRLGG